ncbi:hypothetical protein KUTeg_011826 [Tegillarca granosa]|uniref:C1q domain-containing protein n=1 Tax=Tegillarca granosa TaxID=220873 RepID=A0ABQ9F080_TEGGR|nr:hypothetical protein KUTeg_011826 [Tegillarca granosa]
MFVPGTLISIRNKKFRKVTTIFCLIATILIAVEGINVEDNLRKLTAKRHDGTCIDMGFLVSFLADMKSERREQKKQYDRMEQLVNELSKKSAKLQQQSYTTKQSVKDLRTKLQAELAVIKKLTDKILSVFIYLFIYLFTTRTTNVAFYSWLANENTAHSRVIKYDRVVTNIGNGYSVSTGRFVAPVSGTYAFSVTVSDKSGVGPAHLDIMKNDIEVGAVRSEKTVDMDLGSQTVVLSLKASDNVYIKNRGNHGLHSHRGRYAINTFSGFLIRS